MKLMNFRHLDPDQHGRGLKGGRKDEEEVWSIFASNVPRLRATAEDIAEAIKAPGEETSAYEEEGEDAEEGQVLTREHRYRERDRAIVERRKTKALREHSWLRCEVCSFAFGDRYGERGSGFIECHHTRPVSQLTPGEKTRLEDLALLCANCHRMIHVRRPWLTVEELTRLFRAA